MADEQVYREVPQEFWDVADQFIALANDLVREWPLARVSAAMMYATARFNAFNATQQDAALGQRRDEIVDYFCRQYRGMLLENLDDLLEGEE